jgi:hypothetical protein
LGQEDGGFRCWNLYLHAHCDEEALLILFSHNAKARIIWAHTGFSVPPARVVELLTSTRTRYGANCSIAAASLAAAVS